MAVDEKVINTIFLSDYCNFYFITGNESKKFRTFSSFKKFVETESNFWNQYNRGQLQEIGRVYRNIANELNSLQGEELDAQKVKNAFQRIHNITKTQYFIYSLSALGQFLTKLYSKKGEWASSALQFLICDDGSGISNTKLNFLGMLKAYDFMISIESQNNIVERIASERLDRIAAMHTQEIQKIGEDYKVLEGKYIEELELLKDERSKCKNEFSNINDTQKKSFEQELIFWKDKFTYLEKTYIEHLRLKAPADYWKGLRDSYNKIGRNWVYAAVSVGIIFCTFLSTVFYNFPEWLKGEFMKEHLKGYIIFTLLISIFTYLMHIFIKLSTSAYHLSRDAEERYQLTHVYLALLNEKAIEPSEREIILQALFSRADTGLLKNDGSPTMPGTGSIVDTILKLAKK